MPYTPEHKAATRKRIVQSARRLFNRHGLTGVSIDEIMADAGLTRGGFYNHFDTKEELYAEVVASVLSCEAASWSDREARNQTNIARLFISAYLSQAHLDDRDGSCPLMALPSDVGRGGEPVKRAYRQVLEYMLGNLEKGLSGPHARQRALAVAALCIGGMAVARAVDDPDFANEVREAARAMAMSATGPAEFPAAAE
jgi:AcrR family transcriptional regulator